MTWDTATCPVTGTTVYEIANVDKLPKKGIAEREEYAVVPNGDIAIMPAELPEPYQK